MSFKINNTLEAKCAIDAVNISMRSTRYDNNQLQNMVWIEQGKFQLSMKLEREETTNLIETLNQHLENIKANELDLLVLNTKAAA